MLYTAISSAFPISLLQLHIELTHTYTQDTDSHGQTESLSVPCSMIKKQRHITTHSQHAHEDGE